jgi:hypothetical protein
MPPPTGKDRERREDVVKLRLADDRRDAGELRARCDGIGEWARMVDLGRGGVQAGGLSEMARSPQRLLRVHSESPPCRRGRKPMHEHTEHLAHFLDCPHYTKAGSQLGAPRTNLSVAPRAWRDCPLAYLVGVVLCFSLHSISHLRPHLPLQPCNHASKSRRSLTVTRTGEHCDLVFTTALDNHRRPVRVAADGPTSPRRQYPRMLVQ